MVRSMTGYGKSECVIDNTKYTVEIRSVNGKNADISIKTTFVPREKEMELRNYLTSELGRGSIDLFVTKDVTAGVAPKHINSELIAEYYKSILGAFKGTPFEKGITSPEDNYLAATILRMPDVIEVERTQFGDEEWAVLFNSIKEACDNLNKFRIQEGVALKADVLSKISLIESYIPEIEKYEKLRVDSIKERIFSRLNEIVENPDMNRFEQEMIFFIEKLDINEEKVRLRQHCNYFRETIESEPMPGKKLGFIAQEIGREINTLGSKSNQADMQQWVVRMKDELEKIKEQSLNIL
ncbi:MAG: YicC family protein [Bacteroidales bacterium]|nr:YicC family protein [Bacteroidales bacterium]